MFLHTPFLGGQFGSGGGGATQVTRQVLEISKEVGAPVHLVWSREDDIGHDTQREPVFNRFRAVLGNDGLPVAFTAHTMAAIVAICRMGFRTTFGKSIRSSPTS